MLYSYFGCWMFIHASITINIGLSFPRQLSNIEICSIQTNLCLTFNTKDTDFTQTEVLHSILQFPVISDVNKFSAVPTTSIAQKHCHGFIKVSLRECRYFDN